MAAKISAADAAAFKQLKQDISAGTLGRLYIFHGEEAYLRDFYLGQMKKKLLPAGMEEFNLHTFQPKECDPKRLEQAVDCLPMMSERTMILVHDYDLFKASAGDKEAFTALFADLPDYVCLVFICDLIEYKPDARTKLAGVLKEKRMLLNIIMVAAFAAALMGVNVVYIILASGVVGIVCALTGKGKKHAA